MDVPRKIADKMQKIHFVGTNRNGLISTVWEAQFQNLRICIENELGENADLFLSKLQANNTQKVER